MLQTVFALICIGLWVPLLVGEVQGWFWVRAVTKTLASFAFLAHGLANGLLDGGAMGDTVVVALALSIVGDVLLLSPDRRAFLAGIGAFLLAHVAYIGAFLLSGPSPLGAGVALIPLAAAGFLAWSWIGPGTGRMRPAVLAYMVVISLMVASAAGLLAAFPGVWTGRLFASAVEFYASDLAVARNRFVAPGPGNRIVGLPLYYVAQLGFAGGFVLAH